MNIKRFVANTMQDALKLVREEFGADAVILSNDKCAEGIEIVAALDYDEEAAAASLTDDGHIQVEENNPSKVARIHAKRHVQLQNELSRVKQHVSDVHSSQAENRRVAAAKPSAELDLDAKERELRHKRRLRALHGDRSPVRSPAQRKPGKANYQPDLPERPSAKSGPQRATAPQPTQRSKFKDVAANRSTPMSESRFSGAHDESIKIDGYTAQDDLKKLQEELASLKALIAREGIGQAKTELGMNAPRKNYDDVSLHEDSSWIDISLSKDRPYPDEPARPPRHAEAAANQPSRTDRSAYVRESTLDRLAQQCQKMGLGSDLMEALISEVDVNQDFDAAWSSARRIIESKIETIPGEIIDHGGVIALVGPTGSGKTTTIGKLAARYVMKFGASSIALVTTDCYRIAAHEQLKTLGRILNIPVYTVDEQNPLDEVLDKLSDKRCVLVDTAGLLPTDPNWNQQLQGLEHSAHHIQSYLVVSAVGQYQIMHANHRQYQPNKLSGAIITKVDEAISLGELTRFLIDSRIKVAYFADGQRIPDDIHPMVAHKLIDRAEAMLNNSERWVTISSEPVLEAETSPISYHSAS